MMSGGIDMRIDNPKLSIPVMAILVSLGLSQAVLGIKLDNHTQDNIKGSIKSFDRNNNQKIQTIEIKKNSSAEVNIENCPTVDPSSPMGQTQICRISLSNEKSPHRTGNHIILNNKEKDETLKITAPNNEKYELQPE